jgi:hypothetical protein
MPKKISIDLPIEVEEVLVEYDGEAIDAAWMRIEGILVQVPDELLCKLKPDLYDAIKERDSDYFDEDAADDKRRGIWY